MQGDKSISKVLEAFCVGFIDENQFAFSLERIDEEASRESNPALVSSCYVTQNDRLHIPSLAGVV